ncbi:MAG: chitobiase/beta-hexosaminidase C-terminal domain-containing protein, partial [Opitutaceae bacterium]
MKIQKRFILSVGFLFASALSAQTTNLLNDSFNSAPSSPVTINSSGNSATVFGLQNLPSSARWFPNGATTAAGAAETYNNSTGLMEGISVTESATAYFEPSNSYQTLSIGDTLTLSFNFTTGGSLQNNATGFRFGLINSGSTSTTNQLSKSSGNTIASGTTGSPTLYSGYYAAFDPAESSASTAVTFYSRPASTNSNFIASTASFVNLGGINNIVSLPNSGTDNYKATLTVYYASSTSMVLSFSLTDTTTSTPVSGYTSSATASAIVNQFDTITIGALSATASTMTLTNVNVTYVHQAAIPTFSPVAGTYTSAQSVTIACTTPGSSIAYTTDGSTPTESAGTPTGTSLLYTGPVSVNATTTLNAIGFETGMADSSVATAAYTINIPVAATPTFSPVAGTYTAAQSVTITSSTGGATIRYTTDGSTPTETTGTIYSSPVAVSATMTLNAIAYESGFTDSAVGTAAYTINIPVAATPTFSPVAGTYTAAQSVTITSSTGGASINYTTDGSTPTETHGTAYTTPVSIGSTATLKAIAYETGFTDSSVGSATYTINIPVASTPTFSPVAGTYTAAQSVTISTTTGGATIRYTTDGSTPTETAGTVYSSPVTVSSTETLKAIAYESGFTDSSVGSAGYTINIPGVASTPTFSPVGGSYTSAQSVTITSSTGGASIAYTTDGTTPAESAGTVTNGISLANGGSVSVSTNGATTLKAIAFETGFTDSTVGSATYTLVFPAATPTFSPVAGTYTAIQSVTITTTTGGATIRYTTDGSTPTETAGTVYSS